MEGKILTTQVPQTLADKVEAIAARLDRSRGWIVNQALTDWLEQQESRYRLTLDALADVDSGNFVDHAAMEAWADGLSLAEK